MHDEKLIPQEDVILDLLYHLACWHSLSKLRMHTTGTLDMLDRATVHLGIALRKFSAEVGINYASSSTNESRPQRQRSEAVKPKSSTRNPQAHAMPKSKAATSHGGKSLRTREAPTFNFNTFKVHNLGHYRDCIERHGATDGYSTQLVRALSRFTPKLIN